MAIKWTPALAVGHPGIDAQHQELFKRLDALLVAMASGNRDEITRLFDFLGTYVAEHFAMEEALMQASAYPGLAVHKAAHDRFVRDYLALKKLHDESGATAAVVIKAKSWLVEWLQTHIGSTDQQLARHLAR
ncbi:MAG: bacteriohemerythrin [Anaeromyxobacter sp.]